MKGKRDRRVEERRKIYARELKGGAGGKGARKTKSGLKECGRKREQENRERSE